MAAFVLSSFNFVLNMLHMLNRRQSRQNFVTFTIVNINIYTNVSIVIFLSYEQEKVVLKIIFFRG